MLWVEKIRAVLSSRLKKFELIKTLLILTSAEFLH